MSGDEKSEVMGNILGGILGGFIRIGPTTTFALPRFPFGLPSQEGAFAVAGGGTLAGVETGAMITVPTVTIARPTVAGALTVTSTTTLMATASTGGGSGSSPSSGRKPGKQIGEAGKPYEKAVQEKTGGKSEVINGREIDSVTNDALIQAKDSESAVHKSHNFLNKKTKTQIKETINMAKQQNKNAEFWFKKEPHADVRAYIEDKGGKVVVWKPME